MNDTNEIDHKRDLSRRNMLLASTTLAAASALASAAAVEKAVAQAQQSAPRRVQAEHSRHHGRRCRLVQYRRLSPGHHVGQDAESRQARRRRHALHRLLRRGKLHRRPRQFHHRANSAAHRSDHGRPGRRRCRHARRVRDNRAPAEIDGLCDRAVRQEPSRRLEQVSADGARLR